MALRGLTPTWPLIDPKSSKKQTNSNLTLPALTRGDVQTKLTCETSNYGDTVLRTSVEIDMKCE